MMQSLYAATRSGPAHSVQSPIRYGLNRSCLQEQDHFKPTSLLDPGIHSDPRRLATA